MRIYFGAPVSNDRHLLPQYQLIVSVIEKMEHTVLSKHVVDPKIIPGQGLEPQNLFEREIKRVENADVMVAEVTVPSWGTSFLINHAITHKIPVLTLHYKGEEKAVPLMIQGNPDLYVESYSEDNIGYLLKIFFKHIETIKKRKGKLIVIDGGDGSGKTTQAKMLLAYLKAKKIPVKYVDFPRYYMSFHGKVVGRYLKGEFGSVDATSPYLIALAYAVDRAGAKEEMDEFLEKGGVVVANRYASSSKAFMAAKFTKRSKQDEFINWLDELEYKVHKIPREDAVIYLHVPLAISQKLMEKRGKQQYSGKTKDLHESNLMYLERVEEIYKRLIKNNKHWFKIDCTKNNKILTKEEIHKKILSALEKKQLINNE